MVTPVSMSLLLLSICFLTLSTLVTESHGGDLHGPHDVSQLQTEVPKGTQIQRHTMEKEIHANMSTSTSALGHHMPASTHEGMVPQNKMMMMMMYFHVSGDTTLFFEDWNLNSSGSITGAVFLLFIMAAAFEALKWVREYLKIKADKKLLEKICGSCKKSVRSNNTSSHTSSKEKCCCQRPKRLPVLDNFVQSLLQMAQLFTSYVLMLAVMTYNLWLMMAVVLGSGLGYFIAAFHVPKHLVMGTETDQRCC